MRNRSRNASKIFSSLTAPRNLKSVYLEKIADQVARGRDGINPAGLRLEIDDVCAIISRKTRAGIYEFTAYRQLLSSKGVNKFPRVISVATARDRIILKSLAAMLKEVFPEAKVATPQEKVVKLQEAISGGLYDSFLRVDIIDFYPTISHEAIFSNLGKKIRKKEVILILRKALSTPTSSDQSSTAQICNVVGVPQGLSISNLIAEIAMINIDSKISTRTDVMYLRYVDDIIILCRRDAIGSIHGDLVELCGGVGLKMHPLNGLASKSQSGTLDKTFDYMGYLFANSKVSVRPQSVGKIRSSLARVFTRYKHEVGKSGITHLEIVRAQSECKWRLNLIITGCVLDQRRRGWLHFFSQIDDLSVLKSLDASVRNYITRFNLEGAISPKTFTRTYWEIKSGIATSHSYIPNFDKFTINDKRNILEKVFHFSDSKLLSEDDVISIFYKEIRRLVNKLEQDVGSVS